MTNETARREAVARIISPIDWQMQDDGLDMARIGFSTGPSLTKADRILALLQSPSQPVVAEAANAWRYDPPPAFPRSAVPIIRVYRDKHLAEDGWAETPLYTHPQASPPPVQSEKVSEADVKYLAFILEEWDMKDRPNAWTGHSYEEIARDALARLAHSQTDTQEGDSVAFLATTKLHFMKLIDEEIARDPGDWGSDFIDGLERAKNLILREETR